MQWYASHCLDKHRHPGDEGHVSLTKLHIMPSWVTGKVIDKLGQFEGQGTTWYIVMIWRPAQGHVVDKMHSSFSSTSSSAGEGMDEHFRCHTACLWDSMFMRADVVHGY